MQLSTHHFEVLQVMRKLEEAKSHKELNVQHRTMLLLERKGLVEECESLRSGSLWELTASAKCYLELFNDVV